MKILAFSGPHGTGKTQVNEMVAQILESKGYSIQKIGSCSQRAWKKYYEILRPGEDHSGWPNLPAEDQEAFQLFVVGFATGDLIREYYSSDLDYVLLDRSALDALAYTVYKPDVTEKMRLLGKELMLRAVPAIDHTFIFRPEVEHPSPPGEKADRAPYDKFDLERAFDKVIAMVPSSCQIHETPRGELEDKAEWILKEILHV